MKAKALGILFIGIPFVTAPITAPSSAALSYYYFGYSIYASALIGLAAPFTVLLGQGLLIASPFILKHLIRGTPHAIKACSHLHLIKGFFKRLPHVIGKVLTLPLTVIRLGLKGVNAVFKFGLKSALLTAKQTIKELVLSLVELCDTWIFIKETFQSPPLLPLTGKLLVRDITQT